MKLHEAMNTYNTALHLLKEKGYILSVEGIEEEYPVWVAAKDDTRVSAFSPLSLLALVTIAEHYGPQWRNLITGDVYDALLDAAWAAAEGSSNDPL